MRLKKFIDEKLSRKEFMALSQAESYIAEIDHDGKKKYAKDYLNFLLGKDTEPKPGRGVSSVQAKAVKMKLEELIGKRNIHEKKKKLSVPEKHQERIAKDTLKMSDVMADVMGGMNKKEAKDFLKSIGYTDNEIKKLSK